MFPARFNLAEIPVLDGTVGAGGMAPPASYQDLCKDEGVQEGRSTQWRHVLNEALGGAGRAGLGSLRAQVHGQDMGRRVGADGNGNG